MRKINVQPQIPNFTNPSSLIMVGVIITQNYSNNIMHWHKDAMALLLSYSGTHNLYQCTL